MKAKIFSMMIMLAAIIGSASSCKETPEDVTPKEEKVTIYATLENAREWKQGEEVLINGAKYVITEGETSTVEIADVTKAENYYAAYDFGSGSVAGNTLSLNVPALQGANIKMAQPMVASNSNTNLLFKNVLGNLKLNVEGSGKVLRAVISSTDTPLAGEGSVELDFAGAPVLEVADSGSRSVTYDCGDGLKLPAEISIALPAKSYSGFVVTLYGTDNEIMSGAQISATEILRGESVEKSITFVPDAVPPTYVTATIENDIYGEEHKWAASDVIYINGTPVQLAGGEGTTTAEFGPVATADLYLASTSSASVNGVSGNAMRVAIPTTQGRNTTIWALNPAVAKSNDNNLHFSYLAGVITIEVEGPHTLRKATLSAKGNYRLTGSGVVDMATSARLAIGADASKDAIFDCGTAGMNIEGGEKVRFVVAADSYTEGFTLTLDDVNGQTYSIELDALNLPSNGHVIIPTIRWEGSQNDGSDLSKLGYANCYMVHTEGDYSFKTRLVDNTPVNNISKVDWLWASAVEGKSGNALISNISYADGIVNFTASAEKGNALLAAFDEAGNIVWSWHIWLTDKPEDFDFKNNVIPQTDGQTDGYYCMDRNLGATSAVAQGGYETFGLYYQWGRKDPFIGDKSEERSRDTEMGGWKTVTEPFGNAATLTVCNPDYAQAAWTMTPTSVDNGSIAYATANPMTFLCGDPNASKADWLDKNNMGSEKNNILYDPDKSLWRPFQKSNYDPCPVGYQVPRKAMWVALLSNNCVYTQYSGFVHSVADGNSAWFPCAGYRSAHPQDGGALMSVQNDTGYIKIWSSELEIAETAYCFTFNDPYYNAGAGAAWANGYNVRCVKTY